MSYFLCLCAPGTFESCFDDKVHFTKASSWPLGQMTRGKNEDWPASVVQVGSSSASMVGNGRARRTHNNDHRELLAEGVRGILANCGEVKFLLHWATGTLATERVSVLSEETVSLDELIAMGFDLKEDVLYIVRT